MSLDYKFPIGPETWLVCNDCNYHLHRCHFCGADLTHAEATAPQNHPNQHDCYWSCECDVPSPSPDESPIWECDHCGNWVVGL